MPAVISILLLSLAWLPGLPGKSFVPPEQPPVVEMRVAPGQEFAADGYTNYILCQLKIPEGFHVYWSNPGASGTPTRVEVTAPDGCTIGEVLYPRPSIFNEPEGVTYGYEDRVTFIVPINLRGNHTQPCMLNVKARWLACRIACYMGDASAIITLNPAQHVKVVQAPELEQALKAIPTPIVDRPGTRTVLEDGQLVITGPVADAGPPSFIPGHVPGVVLGKSVVERDESNFRLVVPYQVHSEDSLGNDPRVLGLLAFGTSPLDPSFEITMPIPTSLKASEEEAQLNRRTEP